ncbi:hypothetical protein K7X08_022710 [Anisodus acutangulus]|uniref:Uncharacterized protein n=1 Tax=Anisodus acutangulus TaxID=402998 RepID=A0A9Q1RHE2_9SOLA|nr:hypothetical protein K7X08_022710 [Anisodus acutangulus]
MLGFTTKEGLEFEGMTEALITMFKDPADYVLAAPRARTVLKLPERSQEAHSQVSSSSSFTTGDTVSIHSPAATVYRPIEKVPTPTYNALEKGNEGKKKDEGKKGVEHKQKEKPFVQPPPHQLKSGRVVGDFNTWTTKEGKNKGKQKNHAAKGRTDPANETGNNAQTNKFAALGDGEENNSEENPGSNTTSGAAEPVQKSSDTNKIVKEASGKNMTKEWVHRTFTVPEGDSSSKQQMVTTNKVCVEVPSNVSHEKEIEKETTTIEEEGEIQSNENATEVPESHDTRDPGPDDNTANTPDIVAETEITESSNLGNQNAIIEVIETDEDSAIQVEDVGKEGNANVNAMANTDTIMTINPSTTEAEDIVIEEESNLRDVIKAKETPIVADAGSGRKQQLKDNSKKGSKELEDTEGVQEGGIMEVTQEVEVVIIAPVVTTKQWVENSFEENNVPMNTECAEIPSNISPENKKWSDEVEEAAEEGEFLNSEESTNSSSPDDPGEEEEGKENQLAITIIPEEVDAQENSHLEDTSVVEAQPISNEAEIGAKISQQSEVNLNIGKEQPTVPSVLPTVREEKISSKQKSVSKPKKQGNNDQAIPQPSWVRPKRNVGTKSSN